MSETNDRRAFILNGTSLAAGILAGASAPAQEKHDHQKPKEDHAAHGDYPRDRPSAGGPVGSPSDRGKLVPGLRAAGLPPIPVEAPDLPKLSWKMVNGFKEFHVYARHLRREFLPGMHFDVWSYNDSMPGPTIEANEGDRVRIVLHNELPEPTVLHLHGLELPNAMDGVQSVTQDPVMPGQTFAYELELHQNGTFFYHTHFAMQEAMGLVGLFIIHPRSAYSPPVDHDFGLIVQEWAILPGATVPNTLSMEFNFFTINGRSGPYTTPMVVKLGSRVRIRIVNFSVIDAHPIHLHGHTFWITGTEGGRIPESAWIPGNNVLIGVAQAKEIEFIANNPGDWVMHCHMFHHMMNHMTSMVGMMTTHGNRGMPAGISMAPSMGMLERGPALSEEHGPALGRGLGEQTGNDRTARNGPMQAPKPKDDAHAGHGTPPKKEDPPAGHAKPKDGPHAGHGAMTPSDPRLKVPGFPQDMVMAMPTAEALKKLNKPQTRGMRKDWFTGVEGLMTVVRVLPPDLYEKVVTGKGEVMPGASVPGAAKGKGHEGHEKKK